MKARIICLLLLMPLLAGCDLLFPAPVEEPAAPAATDTPTPTTEPTPTPNIPPVDESLPDLQALTSLPIADWPQRIRLPYLHASGVAAESEAELVRGGQGYLIYTLKGTGDVSAASFRMTIGEDQERITPVPSTPNPYDTGEGLFLRNITGQDADTLLREAVTQYENDDFTVTADEDLSYWNNLIDGQSTLFGALAYTGRYISLQKSDTVIRLFYVNSETQDLLVTMQVEEINATPPMFYYLCAMLSTLRVTG